MFVIVGLGNPGEKYKNTRHNAGAIVLHEILQKNGISEPIESSAYSGRIREAVFHGKEVLFLFPSTYMNQSGGAVKKALKETNIAPSQLIVLYDDVDLPIGSMKISYGKGTGGHNGIASIVKALGTKDFVRIRLGIAKKSFWTGKTKRPEGGVPMTQHVLGTLTRREYDALKGLLERVEEALADSIENGPEHAMNRHNTT